MSEELKPCPFCGGEAVMCGFQDEMMHFVKCRDCGACSDGAQLSAETAAAAWNRRAERTCRMEFCEEWSGDELYPTVAYTCSSCGWVTQEGKPSYCPHCGAKVVDE